VSRRHVPGRVFVLVPCGKSKVFDSPNRMRALPSGAVRWDSEGNTLVQASFVYTSRIYGLYMAFTRKFGHGYMIFSAKHGLLAPNAYIANYSATFLNPNSKVISVDRLKEQAAKMDWEAYDQILILGGKAYREKAREFMPEDTQGRLIFPFEGMDLPQLHKALPLAVERGKWEGLREEFGLS